MEPSEKAAAELVKNSTLYKEFLAEREEILRHGCSPGAKLRSPALWTLHLITPLLLA
jgi:hypothetical protein